MGRIGFRTSFRRHSGPGPASGRKSRVTRFIVGLSSVGLCTLALAAGPDVVDPVFGLAYDPNKVQFDVAPADLLTSCPALTNAQWTRRLWVFAAAQDTGGQYYIVGGFYAAQPGAPAKLMTDPKGAVVELTQSGCSLVGPAREVLQYPDQLVAPPVLRALVTDLVRRYRTAFGGPDALRAALRDQHAVLTGPRDAMLREALAAPSATK